MCSRCATPQLVALYLLSAPRQLQGMLRNLESQFAGAAEVDLSEIMSHLMAGGHTKEKVVNVF